jgi:predicted outer membrane repeat protein
MLTLLAALLIPTAHAIEDNDGDGFSAASDCDDDDANTYPGALEICNGEDNDCDGDAENVGVVSFRSAAGDWTDLTAMFAAGTPASPAGVTLSDDGALYVCDGTYYVSLIADADLSIHGLNGPLRTILSGAGTTRVLEMNSGTTVSAYDLTIKDGYSTNGGGVLVTEATLNLYGVTLKDNTAGDTGGAIYATDSALTLRDATLKMNRDRALYQDGGSLWITDSRITGNNGGVKVEDALLSISDTVFRRNDSDSAGGGLYINGSDGCSLERLVFEQNNSLNNSGGGLYLTNSDDCTLQALSFRSNIASHKYYSGGALYVYAVERLLIEDTKFAGSIAAQGGGVLLASCDDCTIKDSVFRYNEAFYGDGGGVYIFSSKLTSITFTGNTWSGNTPEDVYNDNDRNSYDYPAGGDFVCDQLGCY